MRGCCRLTGDVSTDLAYACTAQVGGKLAQVGARLIDGVAKKMADDFFRTFKAKITPAEAPAPVAAAPAAAAPAAAGYLFDAVGNYGLALATAGIAALAATLLAARL